MNIVECVDITYTYQQGQVTVQALRISVCKSAKEIFSG
jgi:hypothetical protein